MNIAVAAAQVGISAGTLRDYERAGLIAPQRDTSGRRFYTKLDVEQARRIAAERRARMGRGLLANGGGRG